MNIFISGWPRGEGKGGISQYKYDAETGGLELLSVTDSDIAFGTVFVNADKNVLYAVNEIRDPEGGNIYSYKIRENGTGLEFMGKVSTQAPNPSYMGIDKSGRFAVCSNHSMDGFDAPVLLYSVNEDGSIGEMLDKICLEGSSIGKNQDMPHPHCTIFSPDGSFFVVCDKGSDDVRIFAIDKEDGKLVECTRWKETPGYMPRYAVFHPVKPFFYHNNESNAIVNAYSYDTDKHFAPIGEYSAIPEDWDNGVHQQGICIDPEGDYLYTALMGRTGIAVFKVDQTDGSLSLIQNVEENLNWIRDMRITPDGRFLIATFLESGKVVVYRREQDGRLVNSGNIYDCTRAAGIAITEI